MDLAWYRSKENNMEMMKLTSYNSHTFMNPNERCKSLTDYPKQSKSDEKAIRTANTSNQTLQSDEFALETMLI